LWLEVRNDEIDTNCYVEQLTSIAGTNCTAATLQIGRIAVLWKGVWDVKCNSLLQHLIEPNWFRYYATKQGLF
jgi:hypothetical protein